MPCLGHWLPASRRSRGTGWCREVRTDRTRLLGAELRTPHSRAIRRRARRGLRQVDGARGVRLQHRTLGAQRSEPVRDVDVGRCRGRRRRHPGDYSLRIRASRPSRGQARPLREASDDDGARVRGSARYRRRQQGHALRRAHIHLQLCRSCRARPRCSRASRHASLRAGDMGRARARARRRERALGPGSAPDLDPHIRARATAPLGLGDRSGDPTPRSRGRCVAQSAVRFERRRHTSISRGSRPRKCDQ